MAIQVPLNKASAGSIKSLRTWKYVDRQEVAGQHISSLNHPYTPASRSNPKSHSRPCRLCRAFSPDAP